MQIVKTDTDGMYYRNEDTEWLVQPTDDDPGILAPKAGAICLGETKKEAENNLISGE